MTTPPRAPNPRESRSYIKAHGHGETPDKKPAHLYAEHKDGRIVRMWITVARKKVFAVTCAGPESEGAAQERFEALLRGDEVNRQLTEKEIWLEEADIITTSPTRRFHGPLRFGVLAALHYRALEARDRSPIHTAFVFTVARALASLPPVPSEENAFYDWSEKACDLAATVRRVQRTAARDTEGTKRAKECRLNAYIACLEEIAKKPSFIAWQKGLGTVLMRAKSKREELVTRGLAGQSHAPFTKGQIDAILKQCDTVNDLILVMAYLALGTRSGDADDAEYHHLRNDQFILDNIISKRKTGKKPVAPLVLKAVLRFKEEQKLRMGSVPEGVDKRRFRPTCAVLLILSGVDVLSASIRAGHSSLRMMEGHYAKTYPEDYRQKNAQDYLGIKQVTIDGTTIKDGNAYDLFLLQRLLLHAVRLGVVDDVKTCIIAERNQTSIVTDAGAIPDVVNF